MRRLFFSLLRNGSRINFLILIAFGFGLLYLLILSNSVPVKTYLNYASKTTSKGLFENSTESFDSVPIVKTIDDPLGFDISVLNFPNVSDDDILSSELRKLELYSDLPECPDLENITTYKQHLYQASLLVEDLEESEIVAVHSEIKPGGSWKPRHCRAVHKVAVIIPYRDRKSHLNRLLDFLFPILQNQLLDFRFIVTEQYGDDLFNKGRIMNAAFRLAQKLKVDCVIFHDVDMFPQDDRTPYGCPVTPRHLGAFVSNLGYQLWYKEIVGGALAISISDYLTVNGYSNLYWAWGGEDDDMGKRMLSLNFTIERPNQEYARYSMLKHVKRKRTAPKLIYKLLDSAGTRWMRDGVNETGLWTVMQVQKRPLYFHLLVNVGESPVYWRGQK